MVHNLSLFCWYFASFMCRNLLNFHFILKSFEVLSATKVKPKHLDQVISSSPSVISGTVGHQMTPQITFSPKMFSVILCGSLCADKCTSIQFSITFSVIIIGIHETYVKHHDWPAPDPCSRLGWNLIPRCHCLVATVWTLAPNDCVNQKLRCSIQKPKY